MQRKSLPFIFKASYDKANRTSVRSFRGIGAREGCELLAEIGREIGMPVTTDVHSPNEAEIAAEFIDVLQIPAFLCRQTDLIRAAAETGRVVNVKKGQFLAPWDVRNIAEKLAAFGAKKFFFTERGTTFGYNNLVADMRSLSWMREAGYHVIFDATHSVQRPGGAGDATSGDAALAPVLARAALAAGLRRDFHGSARESGARAFRWAESDSAKGFAEASAHVKSYSCCRFVAGRAWSAGARFSFVSSACRQLPVSRRAIANIGKAARPPSRRVEGGSRPEEYSADGRPRSQRAGPAEL